MKVKIGFDDVIYGTIEATPEGLQIVANNQIAMQNILQMQGERSDEEFVRTLPERLKSRVWAVLVKNGNDVPVMEEKSLKQSGNDLFFILKFKNSQVLQRFQDVAKEAYGEEGIDWHNPEEFHLTLVYVPNLSISDTAILTTALDTSEPVDVNANGFGIFSTGQGDESNVLFMNVERTPDLVALQWDIYEFVTNVAEVAKYSDPLVWNPHITLAIADEPFDQDLLPDIGGMTMSGEHIEASVDYEVLAMSSQSEL